MRYGSMMLVFLLAITGCTTIKYVREVPPGHLLLDCPAPEKRLGTNGDLARTLQGFDWALTYCNNDKAALREWATTPN